MARQERLCHSYIFIIQISHQIIISKEVKTRSHHIGVYQATNLDLISSVLKSVRGYLRLRVSPEQNSPIILSITIKVQMHILLLGYYTVDITTN